MEKKDVIFTRHVEEVRKGTQHYRGDLEIAGTTLGYELQFGVPIDTLDGSWQFEEIKEIRRIFQITLKKDGTSIELTDQEYRLFFDALVGFVITFYYNYCSQSFTESNEEPMKDSTTAAISVVYTEIGSCEYTQELDDILSAPKFGCSFATVLH